MKRISNGFVFAVAVATALTFAPSLMAQGFQVGSIIGTVTDQTGGALPGVTVTVTSTERSLTRTDVTDAQGRYRLATLPLGTYRVTGALSGFIDSVRENVRVEQDKATTIDMTMNLAATSAAITVSAQAPVVDPKNQTQEMHVSTREFEKAPVGRSYQSIAELAPGVTANNGGNIYSNGANYNSNQYLFDGVDATDPTTGTFGANLNFEAIQEVNVLTNGVSAEYGRATGAIVSVITKSGTNSFSGSLKAIGTNDEWDAQNKTRNSLTGTSFARERVDHNNIRYDATLGGPIWKDHVWFFGAYEQYKPLSSRATTTFTNQEYTSARDEALRDFRADWQISSAHHIWAKYNDDPISGIVRTYTEGTDLNVLTRQDQGGKTKVAQYNGIFGNNLSLDAMAGSATSRIDVTPYQTGPFDNGAAIYNLTNGKYFNGNYFGQGNYVERPKNQYIIAGTYFADLGKNTHEFKVGVDSEDVESTSYYSYGNNRLYLVRDYDPATGTFTPVQRRDYDNPGPQTSTGRITSLYARDQFSVGPRLNLEAGLRFEDQNGHNDVGTKVVSARTIAPRFSASYDLLGNGKTLILGTAGRYFDFIVQSFTDQYAQSASRANYDFYSWNANTGQYDFVRHVVTAGGSQLTPALDLKPAKMDEFTLGFQQQLGHLMGVSVRGVYRKWDDLVEDLYDFDQNGNIQTSYVNYAGANRTFRAIQTQLDKRFANNWSLLANYTYSRTKGNYFSTFASALLDFPNNMCEVNDPSVGVIPCSQGIGSVQGYAPWDVPHVVNLLGTKGFDLGSVNLTAGVGGTWHSGLPYSKTNTMTVLDANGEPTDQVYTYYYEGSGSDRLPSVYELDGSLEAAFGVIRGAQVGLKLEAFNLTNNQVATGTTRTTWCNADTSACSTQRQQFGAQTSRGQFLGPRTYRVTALVRF